MKVRIVWNGRGGELDAVVVEFNGMGTEHDEQALSRALARLVKGHIVWPGDSFQVEEVK